MAPVASGQIAATSCDGPIPPRFSTKWRKGRRSIYHQRGPRSPRASSACAPTVSRRRLHRPRATRGGRIGPCWTGLPDRAQPPRHVVAGHAPGQICAGAEDLLARVCDLAGKQPRQIPHCRRRRVIRLGDSRGWSADMGAGEGNEDVLLSQMDRQDAVRLTGLADPRMARMARHHRLPGIARHRDEPHGPAGGGFRISNVALRALPERRHAGGPGQPWDVAAGIAAGPTLMVRAGAGCPATAREACSPGHRGNGLRDKLRRISCVPSARAACVWRSPAPQGASSVP